MKESSELLNTLHQLRSISIDFPQGAHGEDAIKVLPSPTEFYETLRGLIRSARSRIILSALYLGDGTLEQQLVDDLRSVLSDPKRTNLKIELIFDHSRAQRGPKSSLDLLAPLIQQYPHQLKVYLYQMPLLRSFPYNLLPGQLQEVAAVYHVKFCLIDSQVILTGANLAHEYFTARQDRYWLITEDSNPSSNKRGIVRFLSGFVEIVSAECFELTGERGLIRGPSSSNSHSDSIFSHRLQQLLSSSSTTSSLALKEEEEIRCLPLIQHQSIGIQVEEKTFLSLLSQQHHQTDHNNNNTNNIVWKFSTPYTNFSSQLSQQILEACYHHQKVEILGPDDCSHGFASAVGFKSLIPAMHVEAFTAAMKTAYQRIIHRIPEARSNSNSNDSNSESNNKENNKHYFYEQLEHFTFRKSGWTFHAKGFWFDLPLTTSTSNNSNNNNKSDTSKRLVGSYIGSSNFGERSWNRDFELGFLFLHKTNSNNTTTISHKFKSFLEEDYQMLKRQCQPDFHLNQKIASFATHPPSLPSKYRPINGGGINNNLLNFQNLKIFFRQRMISLLTRFIKPFL